MKRLTAAVFGLLLAASYATFAQDEQPDRRFYITPSAEYLLGDKQRGLDDTLGYGLSVGKILGRGSNLEFNFSLVEPDAESGETGPSLESYGVSLLMFPSRKDLPWFIVARLAQGQTIFDNADGSSQEIESDQFDIGLGYMQTLGDWPLFGRGPALRLEARYRFDKYSASQAEAYAAAAGIDDNRSYHDYIVGIGLQIPLGADPNASEAVEAPPSEVVVVKAVDSDGDQVPDEQDDCPNTRAGASVNARGCEWDDDKDGVPNSGDRCLNSLPGAAVDASGCSADRDQDGILDTSDQCPQTPRGAPVLADGCALAGDCRLPRPGQTVDGRGCAAEGSVILEGVQFETGSAVLTSAATATLDQIAKALEGNRGVVLEVGGHTDSVGDAKRNLALSERRAVRVKQYLVGKGVSSGTLTARGYGEAKPIRSNDNASGRRANRRVELRVVGTTAKQ